MDGIKLSILIPTVMGREKSFNALEDFLQWQISLCSAWDKVEIQSICDNKEMSIGAKRNKLIEIAKGEYCVMIDDDDTVHHSFVDMVLGAIEKTPDCIGYKELCIYEGKSVKSSDISLKYKEWAENKNGFNFVRSPFYKAPIKTEICRRAPFKDIRFKEDYEFAKSILRHLKKEEYINEFMYHYQYKHEPHEIKYGFQRN